MSSERFKLSDIDESKWLDEQDIGELDDLLTNLHNEDHLRLDAVQGLMAAVAISPEHIEADRWLPLIIGQRPTVDASEQAQRLLELLIRLKHSIDYGITHYCFEPIFAEQVDDTGDVHVDAGGWCEGFSMGVDLLASRWESQMQNDDELIELLSPIMALGVDDGAFADIYEQEIGPLSDAEREHFMQQIPRVLSDVLHYWEDAITELPPRGKKQLH
jgi:uncharacterized protein